jgi:hypothetical protein
MWNVKSIDSEEVPANDVTIDILRYLVAHPSAKDTINGIEKWWLSKSIGREGKRQITESLNLLVTKGWLVARRSLQSETVYSLNESGLSEIKEYLENNPLEPHD